MATVIGVRPRESRACTSAPRSRSKRAESTEPILSAAIKGVETRCPIPGGVHQSSIFISVLTDAPFSSKYLVIRGDCRTFVVTGYQLSLDQRGMGTPEVLSPFELKT